MQQLFLISDTTTSLYLIVIRSSSLPFSCKCNSFKNFFSILDWNYKCKAGHMWRGTLSIKPFTSSQFHENVSFWFFCWSLWWMQIVCVKILYINSIPWKHVLFKSLLFRLWIGDVSVKPLTLIFCPKGFELDTGTGGKAMNADYFVFW